MYAQQSQMPMWNRHGDHGQVSVGSWAWVSFTTNILISGNGSGDWFGVGESTEPGKTFHKLN